MLKLCFCFSVITIMPHSYVRTFIKLVDSSGVFKAIFIETSVSFPAKGHKRTRRMQSSKLCVTACRPVNNCLSVR